ncbi:MAG: hypothetical protein R3F61_25770 [Myxococcota bacterium]
MRLMSLAAAFVLLTGCGLFSSSRSTPEAEVKAEAKAQAKPAEEPAEKEVVDTGANGDNEE